LLIFSKNNAAYESLKSQFFHHSVLRVYAAIVSPPPGKIGEGSNRIWSSMSMDGAFDAAGGKDRGRDGLCGEKREERVRSCG